MIIDQFTFESTLQFSSALLASIAPSPGQVSTYEEMVINAYFLYLLTIQTVVPNGKAPNGWESPSTGRIGFTGIAV